MADLPIEQVTSARRASRVCRVLNSLPKGGEEAACAS